MNRPGVPRGTPFENTGFPRRDVFDTLRAAQTPAERLELYQQRATNFELQKLATGNVELTLLEKGEVEAAEKADILCKVRARGKDGLAAFILWLVDDGTAVKKGDVLVKFDNSGHSERLAAQRLTVAQKQALASQAEKAVERQMALAVAQLRAADSDVRIAAATLKAHEQLADVERKKAELRVQQAKLQLDLVRRKAVNPTGALEVQLAELAVSLAGLETTRVPADLAIEKLKLEAQVQRAKDAVEQRKQEAEEAVATAQAREAAAEALVALESARLDELKEDLAHCTLVAPCDGQAFLQEPSGGSFNAARNVVAVGEPAREGQRLLTISKTGPMQVRIKVDESLVQRLKLGQRAMIALPHLQQTLAGKIQHISPVASMQDFTRSNVRVYPVVVAVTVPSEALRPMMQASVSILVDEQQNVLRVATAGLSQRDGAYYCFVKKEDGIHERKVALGLTGSTHVEIKSGVEAGDEVLVSVRPALGGFSR